MAGVFEGDQLRTSQATLNDEVAFRGQGLHTGREVEVTCLPAEPNTGVVFERVDLPGNPLIPAGVEAVVDTHRSTTLGADSPQREPVEVQTVEHLLAALGGLGVDNVHIRLNGCEVPVIDGSAVEYVDGFLSAGLRLQKAPRTIKGLSRAVWVREGDAYLVALPYEGFKISYTLVYERDCIGTQFVEYDIDPGLFVRELAPARTFGFMDEVTALREAGLIRGGSFENAVIIEDDRILSPLRFTDEFARHKVLDLIGDLALIGPLRSHIISVRSGHALHIRMAEKLKEESVFHSFPS